MGLRTGLSVLAPMRRLVLAALLAVLTTAIMTVGFGLATVGAAPAHAETPPRLVQPVLDTAGALTDAQHTELQKAIDDLYDSEHVQLWVVYVKDFGTQSAAQWAKQTETVSELGDSDVLLAVATGSGAYYLDAAGKTEGLDAAKLRTVSNDYVKPQVHDRNWAQAGIAATDGITKQVQPSYTWLIVGGIIVVLILIAAVAGYLYFRRKRSDAIDEPVVEPLPAAAEELTADQLSAQPLSVLDPWSKEVLTDTDNAVWTSADELALAEAEFGTTETAPFRESVQRARSGLTACFELRQRLDDETGAADDERRAMLVQIITTCTDVDAGLDEQAATFDEMRNLLINADGRLDELTREVAAVRARLQQAAPVLADLTVKYGPDALTSIAHNVELAAEQIEFADDSADQGREATAAPAGEQGPAIAAIRSTEGALAQANRLIDAITNAEANLRAARTQLPALITEVENQIAHAQTLTAGGDGAADLTAAVATASSAVAGAKSNAVNDLLGSFSELIQADAALDAALDAATQRSTERIRRTELLTAALTTAATKASAARDFIDTRRGAVQATARTRLAEAQRLLDQARRSAHTDDPDAVVRAIDAARRSSGLADQALAAAQADVASWQQAESTDLAGTASTSGAVLAGVLVDSFVRGASDVGGFSTGGRSPASYGGTGTAGRIGTGGRL